MADRLRSPEAEAGGGVVLPPDECARLAIEDCGSVRTAIDWAQSWAHRPYFKEVLDALKEQQAPAPAPADPEPSV